MSWTATTVIVVVIGFAVFFALCEWAARRARPAPDDESPTG